MALKITDLAWGIVTLSDGRIFKDCILTPEGAQAWDWGRDGTRHQPGITRQAVEPLLQYDVIVVTRGVHKRLHITPEALRALETSGKQFHIADTKKAVQLYHKALEDTNTKVALLLHSTC